MFVWVRLSTRREFVPASALSLARRYPYCETPAAHQGIVARTPARIARDIGYSSSRIRLSDGRFRHCELAMGPSLDYQTEQEVYGPAPRRAHRRPSIQPLVWFCKTAARQVLAQQHGYICSTEVEWYLIARRPFRNAVPRREQQCNVNAS